MDFISFLLQQLLAAYTVLVEPLLRTNFYRNLKKQIKVDPNARLLFYRTQVLWEWSWVIILIVILIPIQNPLTWLGLTMPSTVGWIILAALVIGIGLSIVLLRQNPRALANMQSSLEATSIPLPVSNAERKWFIAAAITAGVCEELLYRGFLIRYAMITFPGLDFLLISILSGIIYGISRVYQGMKGILQTSMMGFSFAIVYFLSGNLISIIGGSQGIAVIGSVLPAMVFHALAELRPLFLWQPEANKKKAR